MPKQSFSLTELSVALVIISLITTGVIAASTITKQARLRTIMTEVDFYISAIASFKTTYNYLPGDIPVATSLWSGTYNGNGNTLVDASNNEPYILWQHLALANLIPGQYNGSSEPQAQYGNGTFWRVEDNGSTIYTVAAGTKSSLELLNNDNFISAVDAYSVDIKIDDGIPSNGWLQTHSGSAGCALESDGVTPAIYTYASTNTTYALSVTDPDCARMYFYLSKFIDSP